MLDPYTVDQVLAAFPPVAPTPPSGNGQDHTAGATDDLVRLILIGEAYHQPLTALAWRYVADGMIPVKVVQTLQGLMKASSGPRDDRWCARFAEIPRTVATAEQKLVAQGGVISPAPIATVVEEDWPEPDLSVLEEHRLPAPQLPLEVFGDYWGSWLSAQAEAKSCALDYVAAGLLAGAGVLIGNARWGSPWPGWAEPPVLWAAGVGNPSSGKSPGPGRTTGSAHRDRSGRQLRAQGGVAGMGYRGQSREAPPRGLGGRRQGRDQVRQRAAAAALGSRAAGAAGDVPDRDR
jgi:hypothetical protein